MTAFEARPDIVVSLHGRNFSDSLAHFELSMDSFEPYYLLDHGARSLERLSDVPAADISSLPAPSALADVASSSTSFWASIAAKPVLIAATAFSVGVGTGVVGTKAVSDAPEPIAAPVAVVLPDAAPPLPAPVDASPAEIDAESLPPPTAGVHKKTAPANEKRPAQDVELAAERALINTARTALLRGRGQVALNTLREHYRKFRNGWRPLSSYWMRAWASLWILAPKKTTP